MIIPEFSVILWSLIGRIVSRWSDSIRQPGGLLGVYGSFSRLFGDYKLYLTLQVAAAMGVMCLVSSIIYLADFFWCLFQRSSIYDEE